MNYMEEQRHLAGVKDAGTRTREPELDEATYGWSADHDATQELQRKLSKGRMSAWIHRGKIRQAIKKGGTPTAKGRQPPGKGAHKRLKALNMYLDATKAAIVALEAVAHAQEAIEDSV